MPIGHIAGSSPKPDRSYGYDGSKAIIRAWFLRDKDGIEVRIDSPEKLQTILDQMSSEELERWKANLRFEPVRNGTGIKDYTGTLRDLS